MTSFNVQSPKAGLFPPGQDPRPEPKPQRMEPLKFLPVVFMCGGPAEQILEMDKSNTSCSYSRVAHLGCVFGSNTFVACATENGELRFATILFLYLGAMRFTKVAGKCTHCWQDKVEVSVLG